MPFTEGAADVRERLPGVPICTGLENENHEAASLAQSLDVRSRIAVRKCCRAIPIDGCVVNEPFAAAVIAGMPASRWSAWIIGCAGLNRRDVAASLARFSVESKQPDGFGGRSTGSLGKRGREGKRGSKSGVRASARKRGHCSSHYRRVDQSITPPRIVRTHHTHHRSAIHPPGGTFINLSAKSSRAMVITATAARRLATIDFVHRDVSP